MGCDVVDYQVPFAGDRLWRMWLTHRHLMVGGQFHALVQDPQTRKLLKPALIWEVEGLDGMRMAVAIARRAGLGPSDVLNTLSPQRLLDRFGSPLRR
ncbi:amidase [compost metagenome]